MGARSKSSSQRAVAHEEKLKQKRDAKLDRHPQGLSDVDVPSPTGTEVASPSVLGTTTPLGTSPKRQPKKAATPRDDVADQSPGLASKRARADSVGANGSGSAGCLSDSAKLDRLLLLAEHNSERLDKQGSAMEDLQRRVAALELHQKVPSTTVAQRTSTLPSVPTLPPSLSLPTPPPPWTSSMPPRPAAGSKTVTFGSSIGSGNLATSSASQRAGTPGPKSIDSDGDKCLLHITNFPTPLSHMEMVKYCVDTLGVPEAAKVVTRGFFAQRVSIRFETEDLARTFHDDFRAAEHKLDGTRLYVQRDLPPKQRRMGYVLRAARRILAKNGIAVDSMFISTRDGILYLDKYPILSVFHESPRFLKRWPHDKVATDIIMAEITGCG
eukprot:4860303-Amphidinium_carterae.3